MKIITKQTRLVVGELSMPYIRTFYCIFGISVTTLYFVVVIPIIFTLLALLMVVNL